MVASTIAQDLRSIMAPDAVIDPADRRYDALRRVWNAMIDRYPTVIAQPRDADEVAGVIRLAARHGLPLAVRGGAHSFPGFSTCDAGVVLDLSRLNAVTNDPGARIATVGGGALLGDLDKATVPHGLVTPAGLVSHTGAGGLTLGGGMGWTSRRLGLTIDSLISAEVVTANSDLIVASESSHPDLFWGLRGGGGNFGVVTRFTYRQHPLGPVTVGVWDYTPDRFEAALEGLAQRLDAAPRSQTTTIGVTADGLRVTAFHSGVDGLGRDSVQPFSALAGQGEGGFADIDYVTLQKRSDDFVRWGRRYYGRGGFLRSLDADAIRAMAQIVRNSPNADSEIYMIHLGGAVSDVTEDATAYAGRAAQCYWIVQAIWDDPADDDACLAWGRASGQLLAEVSQAGNYVNELSDTGRQVSLQAYGEAKYGRLSRLKAQYDPANLFRLNQNIAPAEGVVAERRPEA